MTPPAQDILMPSDGSPQIALKNEHIELSIVIVNFNTVHILEKMFAALQTACEGIAAQIIVVDNASSDGSVEYLRARQVGFDLIINDRNVGFGRANNQALPMAGGEFILLVNTDAIVSENCIRESIAYMRHDPRCGILGAKLVDGAGRLQPSCRFFPTPWRSFLQMTGAFRLFPHSQLVDDPNWDPTVRRECDWVPGCYYLVRREVIEQVGFFDSRYFLYSEEVDHCRAAKLAGWRVVYLPSVTVVHLGGESSRFSGSPLSEFRQISHMQIESELLFYRKHHGVSGVTVWLLLSFFAACILSLKSFIRGRGLAVCSFFWINYWAICISYFRTGAGATPTR